MLFPFHKYLGPGNAINFEEPVDEDDRIALLHDLQYEQAVNRQDVSNADAIATNDFVANFLATGNWHSVVGFMGLLGKQVGEAIFGHVYPEVMAPVTHRGNRIYAAKQKQLSALRQAFQKLMRTKISFKDFQRQYGNPRAYAELRKDVEQAGIGLLPHWTEAPDEIGSQLAGPSNLGDSSDDFQPTRPSKRLKVVPRTTSSTTAPTTTTTKGPFNLQSEESALESPLDSSIEFQPNMDVDDPPVDLTQEPGEHAEAGGGTSAGIAHSSAISIPKSISSNEYVAVIKKSRILYSVGYAITEVKDSTLNQMLLTTPLAYVPVDVLGWYINGTELLNLGGSCTIKEVETKCIVLGTRTSFITGASITSQATHEHIPIVISNIGLNHRAYHEIMAYKGADDKQMVPATVGNYDLNEQLKKWYGDPDSTNNIGCSQLAIRAMGGYATLVNNATVANIPSSYHDEGWFLLDTAVKRNLVNSVIGKDILNYRYVPRNGIVSAKVHDLPTGTQNKQANQVTAHSAGVPPSLKKTTAKQKSDGTVVITEALQNVSDATTFTSHSKALLQPIEKLYVHRTGGTPHLTLAQPRAYVGLLPQQHVNPSSPVTDFLNANVLFNFETKIVLHINKQSIYGHTSAIHGGPLEHYVVAGSAGINYNSIQPFGMEQYAT